MFKNGSFGNVLKVSLILLLLTTVVLSTDANPQECGTSKAFRSCFPKGCTNSSVCVKCTTDWMCDTSKQYKCTKTGKCSVGTFSSLTLNLEWFEILSIIVVFFICLTAVIGGIGGGIMLVSAFLVVGQYHLSSTSPMSTSIVFGASVAAVIMLSGKKHPSKKCNRPLIDYDLVSTVQPIIISGTLFGVLLNAMFPQWLLLIVIMGIYAFAFFNVTRKFIKMYRKENKMREKKQKLKTRVEEESGKTIVEVKAADVKVVEKGKKLKIAHEDIELKDISKITQKSTTLTLQAGEKKEVQITDTEEKLMGEITEAMKNIEEGEEGSDKDEGEEAKKGEDEVEVKVKKYKKFLSRYESFQYPFWKWLWIGFAWIAVLLASLFKGSKKVNSILGVEACSGWYWGIIVIVFFILLFQGYIHSFAMFAKYKLEQYVSYEYMEGDLKWNIYRTIFLPIIFISSGVIASLVGTGGGLINGPLMMLLGMNAQVVIATNLLMIMVTSSSSWVQFLVAQKIAIDYAIILVIVGFLASLIGRLSSSYIIKKTGRRSTVVMILDVLIALSAFSSLGVGIYKIVVSVQVGENQGFESPC